MKGFELVSILVLLSAASCRVDVQPDHQEEWRDVLKHKPAAVAPDAGPEHKQVYADSVRAFTQKHPDHSRSREVWQKLQVEFAEDLAGIGRLHDAIRLYRSVLTHHPENQEALRGLEIATDRLAVTRDKLLRLEKGMSEREVAALLGRPIPGWTTENRRPEAKFEAWYYRTQNGSIAGVYFRDGRVFAAEEESSAPLGRLGS